FSVERFLHGDMGHSRAWGGSVPVLLARQEPDHVASADFDNRLALALRPPTAGGDDQGLTEWVSMPCRACARLKCYGGTGNTGGQRRGVERIDAHDAGKVFGG